MKLSTNVPDKDYNLISVLYHALKGADKCDVYIKDAEEDNDEELAEFFKETKEKHMELAGKAKKLIAGRIS